MKDPLQMLLDALGPGWYVVGVPNAYCLRKGAMTFVSSDTRDGLLRGFVDEDPDFGPLVDDGFGIPEFLRCSSVEELLLKLEVLHGDT